MLKRIFETFIKGIAIPLDNIMSRFWFNRQHTRVVETGPKHGTNNPISYYGLVTREPDREGKA